MVLQRILFVATLCLVTTHMCCYRCNIMCSCVLFVATHFLCCNKENGAHCVRVRVCWLICTHTHTHTHTNTIHVTNILICLLVYPKKEDAAHYARMRVHCVHVVCSNLVCHIVCHIVSHHHIIIPRVTSPHHRTSCHIIIHSVNSYFITFTSFSHLMYISYTCVHCL